ncbi:MAG: dinitrogenase iron-molybdenum cofactor [Deltaproteobacteria bacterium]|nr:dinitrogenase iron-molybdenum cofactor [Deltaproteobacteria bacterium]
MKIAFPVKENNGLSSVIDEHFGVAKNFLIVDMETREFELKKNPKISAKGSKCKTTMFEKEDKVSAVVTKCMGDGSKRSLTSSKIKIYQAQEKTILENLELMEKDELKLFHIFDICQNKKNKKTSSCGHHH